VEVKAVRDGAIEFEMGEDIQKEKGSYFGG